MTRNERNEQALRGASKNAEKAFNAVDAIEYASVPEDEKVAWAMAAMIHCDMCRLVIAFDECERDGLASLLWMADIVSKLHEAKRWYFEKGGRLLGGIGKRMGCGQEYIQREIKEIKKRHQITNIDAYAEYRNKISYHYDDNAISLLKKFGNEDAEAFYQVLKAFAGFSGEWAQLTRSLLKNELPNNRVEQP
ncbi:hypothetical protein [Geomonas anaerohicana]|uniref:Uncharacterized protein n=1 Tax=Geomonas anaerohicana TaxID=2798583 RepID=A0ABS0YFP1_9BACT|nr:hypothetical protein [Geomonas anaerohicana]MBJ6750739.1 hypothetical protein [Geomonas anaerohicana]